MKKSIEPKSLCSQLIGHAPQYRYVLKRKGLYARLTSGHTFTVETILAFLRCKNVRSYAIQRSDSNIECMIDDDTSNSIPILHLITRPRALVYDTRTQTRPLTLPDCFTMTTVRRIGLEPNPSSYPAASVLSDPAPTVSNTKRIYSEVPEVRMMRMKPSVARRLIGLLNTRNDSMASLIDTPMYFRPR